MKQSVVSVLLVIAMALFGAGTYNALTSLRGAGSNVQRPASSLVTLPGTLYLAQGGAIYMLHGGHFKQITPAEGWAQPSASPDGSHLVAIKRSLNASDIYLLGTNGHVEGRLTNNASKLVESNHWAFYPRFSSDGSAVFYSYDAKDPYNSYRVDLAIRSRPADPAAIRSTDWTLPNAYTGGDIGPVPLNQGLIFTRHSIDLHSEVHSQVWFQPGPGSAGVALTAPADDCAQPAVSLDGKALAMVCRRGQVGTTDLAVAPLDLAAGSIGTAITLVTGKLVAAPVFSGDGSKLAYLSPAGTAGRFQLWTVAASGSGAIHNPVQVTQNLGFDATSTPVWLP